MLGTTKNDLLAAPVIGYCPHIAEDPPSAVAFGRMWQKQGAAELCEECFWGARDLAIKAAKINHKGWSHDKAAQYVDAHSVHGA